MNQCDGCMQRAPMRGKLHIDEEGRAFMACERDKYADAPKVEAGEMPQPGPGEADCRMCDGRGVYGIPGARCSFCKGIGRVQFWRPRDDAAPKVEAREIPAKENERG